MLVNCPVLIVLQSEAYCCHCLCHFSLLPRHHQRNHEDDVSSKLYTVMDSLPASDRLETSALLTVLVKSHPLIPSFSTSYIVLLYPSNYLFLVFFGLLL